MKVIIPYSLEKYLEESTISPGKRRHIRFKSIMPIYYSFYGNKKKPEFFECYTIDISTKGIAIEINDPLESIKKLLTNNKNNKVILKVKIPNEKESVEIQGEVKWKKFIKYKDEKRIVLGISYDNIDYIHKIISFFMFALKLNRRKKFVQACIFFLIIAIVTTGVWGLHTAITKNIIMEKLEITEITKDRLQNEIKELVNLKNKQLGLIKNAEVTLKKKEIDLEKIRIEKDLNENNLKNIVKTMEQNNVIISRLEERIYDYVVKSDTELIYVGKGFNYSIFTNENYKKAKIAMANKKYKEAIILYNGVINELPDSPLGYSGLARALYRLGRLAESQKIFNKYLHISKQQVK